MAMRSSPLRWNVRVRRGTCAIVATFVDCRDQRSVAMVATVMDCRMPSDNAIVANRVGCRNRAVTAPDSSASSPSYSELSKR
ncbi:hypothetical protein DERF_001196 [Dermatophagoides farinae]|uniref:Uncharacterized protein n=1 Tax=Dermatophagoides farinae TaxID=6954 RepID=A0A922L8F5_DERFA|nr:hypothetical protein DERF_001196 [Dermatophagoides farinae]